MQEALRRKAPFHRFLSPVPNSEGLGATTTFLLNVVWKNPRDRDHPSIRIKSQTDNAKHEAPS